VGNGKEDLKMLLINGLAQRVAEGNFPGSFTSGGASYSFVMIFPQFRIWPKPEDVQAVIDHALQNYRIDPKRVYLAGMSMGGGTTWDYAAVHGRNLAAMVTICGASQGDSATNRLIAETNTPVWAFHNQGDKIVNVGFTTSHIQMITAVNPDYPYRMTIWPSPEHDAWTEATNPEYREEGKNMYEWMLQYTR
jgi:dienelactone hydrolase